MSSFVQNETFIGDFADGEHATVRAFSQRLVNEGGAWVGTGYTSDRGYEDATPGTPASMTFATLAGDGDYEGLTLILSGADDQLWGWIAPSGSVPALPETSAE